MEFENRVSTATNTDIIIEELTRGLANSWDLGLIFLSQQQPDKIQSLIDEIRKKIKVKTFIGCTGAGIIGSNSEIEHQPSSSLILANLPNVNISPFHIGQEQLESFQNKKDLYQFFEIFPTESPVFIALPDPFMFDMNRFLRSFNLAYPNCPIVGGLASAAAEPGGNVLIIDDEYYEDGMIGVVLTGDVGVRTVVSQGCRPIGETYIVTKVEDNVIYELAGKSFLEILSKILDQSSARDKLLAQEALFVGIAMDEYKHEFKRGDFLIRGVMGIDHTTGAGIVGDYIRLGQTIQFHVRDADTATEDLNALLNTENLHLHEQKPKGALIFSCNGRGEHLFRKKNHDIEILQKHVGPVPAAGFFCAGEIGPIGNNNFLHGFTDSIALFYPKKILKPLN